MGEEGAVAAGVGRHEGTFSTSGRHSDTALPRLRVLVATAGVGAGSGSLAIIVTTFLVLAGTMGVVRSTTSSVGSSLAFSGVLVVLMFGVVERDFPFRGEVLVMQGVTDLDLVLGVTVPELGSSEGVEWLSRGVVVRDLRILSTGVWVVFDCGNGDKSSCRSSSMKDIFERSFDLHFSIVFSITVALKTSSSISSSEGSGV